MSAPEATTSQVKRRPAVVTIAFVATLLAVPGLVASALPNLLFTESLIQAYQEIYAGTVAEEAVAGASATPYQAVSLVMIGAAVILLAAAFLALGGNRPGRLVIWILGPLIICTSAPVLLWEPGQPRLPPGAPPRPVVEQILSDAVPAWSDVAGPGGAGLAAVSLLVAVVLFGVPRANDFFRPEPPTVVVPPLHHG